MSIEIGTFSATGVNSLLRRLGSAAGTDILDNKGPYTVMFRMYVPDSNPSNDWMWALGNNTGGAITLDRDHDALFMNSTGVGLGQQFVGSAGGAQLSTGVDFTTGWYTIAMIHQGPTGGTSTPYQYQTIRIRVGTGTINSWTAGAKDVSGRTQASLYEFIFGNALSGANMAAGARIMNYKSWSRPLTAAQVTAEDLQTTVADSSGLFAVSPMIDTLTLANNLTATYPGSPTTPVSWWTAGSGLIAGANDPAVVFGGPFAFSQVGQTSILGSHSVAGNLGITQKRWRIPTNAAVGTAMFVQVFNGSRGTYTHNAQGTAVVANDGSGNCAIIPAGSPAPALNDVYFALVHNYTDSPIVASIFGGPCLATCILE